MEEEGTQITVTFIKEESNENVAVDKISAIVCGELGRYSSLVTHLFLAGI